MTVIAVKRLRWSSLCNPDKLSLPSGPAVKYVDARPITLIEITAHMEAVCILGTANLSWTNLKIFI